MEGRIGGAGRRVKYFALQRRRGGERRGAARRWGRFAESAVSVPPYPGLLEEPAGDVVPVVGAVAVLLGEAACIGDAAEAGVVGGEDEAESLVGVGVARAEDGLDGDVGEDVLFDLGEVLGRPGEPDAAAATVRMRVSWLALSGARGRVDVLAREAGGLPDEASVELDGTRLDPVAVCGLARALRCRLGQLPGGEGPPDGRGWCRQTRGRRHFRVAPCAERESAGPGRGAG